MALDSLKSQNLFAQDGEIRTSSRQAALTVAMTVGDEDQAAMSDTQSSARNGLRDQMRTLPEETSERLVMSLATDASIPAGVVSGSTVDPSQMTDSIYTDFFTAEWDNLAGFNSTTPGQGA